DRPDQTPAEAEATGATEAVEEEAHRTFVDIVRKELEALAGRVDMLRVDAALARMASRDEVETLRRQLGEQRDAVRRRIDDLAGASTSAWGALRDGVDRALGELRSAVERARREVTRSDAPE
ncbi:MAG TPA: hypothetical protein VFC99_01380, partial [Acidimicrobiia bacterium]|nr:hypothetical protein [Acidimicrobiia bacterium]